MKCVPGVSAGEGGCVRNEGIQDSGFAGGSRGRPHVGDNRSDVQILVWERPAEAIPLAPQKEKSFQRIATLGNYLNNGADAADETVSEIIAATANGRTLVYTDAIRGTIGLIDITNPSNPQPLGTLPLDPDPDDDIEHSPTAVDVLGNRYALVAVDTTSGEFATPSGYLLVVDISDPAAPVVVTSIDLQGQPDSLKISHDQRFAAIAIENQRNEDLCVGGSEDGTEADEDDCVDGGGVLGGLPQAPAGFLVVIRLAGPPSGWAPQNVDLTGFVDSMPPMIQNRSSSISTNGIRWSSVSRRTITSSSSTWKRWQ